MTKDDRLSQAKEVLARHSTVRGAAGELGVTTDALTNLFRREGQTASGYLNCVMIPDGHRVKGNSTLIDPTGKAIKSWVKTERESSDPPAFEPVPPDWAVQKVSTQLDGQGQVRSQWVQALPKEQERWEAFWAACKAESEAYRGQVGPTPIPTSTTTEENLLTAYPWGDPHFGLMSWTRETNQNFDLKIAKEDMLKVSGMLIDRAPPSRVGVLVNVGDLTHIDNDKQLTPQGGNKLDADGRWVKILETVFSVMREVIMRLLVKHETVIIVNVPGNHDPQTSRVVNLWLKAVFEREPRVTILDNANPIMYLRHGKVFFGFCHGDQFKTDQLPLLMAAERPDDWGETLHRMWITGHIHHQVRKEHPGCVVESFRTLAPADAWHHGKGYLAGRSLCAITFDAEHGEISRSTVDLRYARATSTEKGDS